MRQRSCIKPDFGHPGEEFSGKHRRIGFYIRKDVSVGPFGFNLSKPGICSSGRLNKEPVVIRSRAESLQQ